MLGGDGSVEIEASRAGLFRDFQFLKCCKHFGGVKEIWPA